MDFQKKLENSQLQNNSLLCVGLDPDATKLSGQNQFEFNKKIIDQTKDLVCAFKPQIAFYSSEGEKGLRNLISTIKYIKNNTKIPVILDAKRGDVEHTSRMYAKELFDVLGADAATVNPYLGFDSINPFLERIDKGIFVICRTSNPGANDFQDLKVVGEPLYLAIARKIVDWSKMHSNLFLEVGATWPKELKKIRELSGSMLLLVPGVGAQGGDLQGTVKAGLSKNGKGLIISASRSIIYAPSPRGAAQKLKDEINKYR